MHLKTLCTIAKGPPAPPTLRTINSLRTIGALPPVRGRNRRKSGPWGFALRVLLVLGAAASLAGYALHNR